MAQQCSVHADGSAEIVSRVQMKRIASCFVCHSFVRDPRRYHVVRLEILDPVDREARRCQADRTAGMKLVIANVEDDVAVGQVEILAELDPESVYGCLDRDRDVVDAQILLERQSEVEIDACGSL